MAISFSRLSQSRRRSILAIITIAVLVAVAVGSYFILRPKPSVEAYCKTYVEQREDLLKGKGSAYRSSLFAPAATDNINDLVNAVKKMERVAPDEIKPAVNQLWRYLAVLRFTEGNALTGEALNTEITVQAWTIEHCPAISSLTHLTL